LIVDVQAHAGAPSGAGALVVARQRLDRHLALEPGHPLQRLGEHPPLQLALMGQGDVPELRAAGSPGRIHLERRRRPDVRDAMLARLQHPHRVGAPERLLAVVRHPRDHALARDRVGHEHDTAVVPRHGDAAVGDSGHVEFELASDRFTHPSSLGASRAPVPRVHLAGPAGDAARGGRRTGAAVVGSG
jgi:hypothetical protein